MRGIYECKDTVAPGSCYLLGNEKVGSRFFFIKVAGDTDLKGKTDIGKHAIYFF